MTELDQTKYMNLFKKASYQWPVTPWVMFLRFQPLTLSLPKWKVMLYKNGRSWNWINSQGKKYPLYPNIPPYIMGPIFIMSRITKIYLLVNKF